MEQLVLLLVIGLISFINWLIQRANQKKKPQEDTSGVPEFEFDFEEETSVPQPPPIVSRQGGAERNQAREFMEALGIPQESAPRSPAKPPPLQQAQPKAPVRRGPPPAQLSQPAPWNRPEIQTEELSKAEREALARIDSGKAGEAYTIRLRDKRVPGEEVKHPSRDAQVVSLLRSASGLRAAVVLREVLGQPPGLQPLPGPSNGISD